MLTLTNTLPLINAGTLPEDFCYLQDLLPSISYDIRYATSNNFTGMKVDGYHKEVAILTCAAAEAFVAVVAELDRKGYSVKVFDTYRPTKAVAHFARWANDLDDTISKQQYYPNLHKKDLFSLGYIAERSGHSRGSTIDLTLIDKATGEELDMGSPFDLFDTLSNHGASQITALQEYNRSILKEVMFKHGFKTIPEEWWHFTLVAEPFPDTYFDFEVQ